MPSTHHDALRFLESQWSSSSKQNEVLGIIAETEFKQYLMENSVLSAPGSWILTPGNNTFVDIPAKSKICLLPLQQGFSLQATRIPPTSTPTIAHILAYNFFRRVGTTAYFVYPDKFKENEFRLPAKKTGRMSAKYPRDYNLKFWRVSFGYQAELEEVAMDEVLANFPKRKGLTGMRCNENQLSKTVFRWNDTDVVSSLFWFEYARYFCQVEYMVSNNDLDMFIIGLSGTPYPVELKSKTVANDKVLGEWFGLDVGPFAKMSYFTSNNINTDALYVVQEVEESTRIHMDWFGIKFTDLVASCSWVFQSGGKGMTGAASSTIKIPKSAFTRLSQLLPTL